MTKRKIHRWSINKKVWKMFYTWFLLSSPVWMQPYCISCFCARDDTLHLYVIDKKKLGRLLSACPVEVYGLSVISCVTQMPFRPLLEHAVMVPRILCPVGS